MEVEPADARPASSASGPADTALATLPTHVGETEARLRPFGAKLLALTRPGRALTLRAWSFLGLFLLRSLLLLLRRPASGIAATLLAAAILLGVLALFGVRARPARGTARARAPALAAAAAAAARLALASPSAAFRSLAARDRAPRGELEVVGVLEQRLARRSERHAAGKVLAEPHPKTFEVLVRERRVARALSAHSLRTLDEVSSVGRMRPIGRYRAWGCPRHLRPPDHKRRRECRGVRSCLRLGNTTRHTLPSRHS
mmetsp:Transcript_26347/g.85080  ORF Transcript_26347/g.85080 Transcript_26347/m.85080 type:complete len:258 (+) Transcript_26347:161-934(+)